mmetsp:Transcript_14339/g.56431  ORF Transcript_14339/g.56431 Transcript_14339/m.56431 type:complete len:229 (+) Transcript_14339:26-712(+)
MCERRRAGCTVRGGMRGQAGDECRLEGKAEAAPSMGRRARPPGQAAQPSGLGKLAVLEEGGREHGPGVEAGGGHAAGQLYADCHPAGVGLGRVGLARDDGPVGEQHGNVHVAEGKGKVEERVVVGDAVALVVQHLLRLLHLLAGLLGGLLQQGRRGHAVLRGEGVRAADAKARVHDADDGEEAAEDERDPVAVRGAGRAQVPAEAAGRLGEDCAVGEVGAVGREDGRL